MFDSGIDVSASERRRPSLLGSGGLGDSWLCRASAPALAAAIRQTIAARRIIHSSMP
jgi:hypothetical protein